MVAYESCMQHYARAVFDTLNMTIQGLWRESCKLAESNKMLEEEEEALGFCDDFVL